MRNPGQVPDRRQVLKGPELQIRGAGLARSRARQRFINVAVERGVVVEQFAEAPRLSARILVHVLGAVEDEAAAVAGVKGQVVTHLRFAGNRVDPQVAEVAFGLRDGAGYRPQPFQVAERDGSLNAGLVRITIHKFVDVPGGYADLKLAGHAARGIAGRRSAPGQSQVSRAPRARSRLSGEIPSLHLFVEGQANSVRKLRVEERSEQTIGGQVLGRGAQEEVIESKLPVRLGLEDAQ